MSAMTSASLQRCNSCLVFGLFEVYFCWSVFLIAAGIICSSSLSDGPARCRLVHLTAFSSKVQNCGPWQLLEQVLEQLPAFTAGWCLFCLVRSPGSV